MAADAIDLCSTDDDEPPANPQSITYSMVPECSQRCGRRRAPGRNPRSGNFWLTCCGGCATGRGHDIECNSRAADGGSSSSNPPAVVGTKRKTEHDDGPAAKQAEASLVVGTWNAQSLLPSTENRDKLKRLLPRLPLLLDLLFVQETQLVSSSAQRKLPAARALLPGYTFHPVPVANSVASENAAKGTGVYVRDDSALAAGGALDVDLAADPWGALSVWRCPRGVIIGGRLPVPTGANVATRRRLEDRLEALLQKHGAQILAVVGDLNVTPDLQLDATQPWTGREYAASRDRLHALQQAFLLRDVWRAAHPTERRWTTYQERESRSWQARCDLVLVPEAHAAHAEVTIVDGPGFVNAERTKSSGKELAGSDHVPVLLAMRL